MLSSALDFVRENPGFSVFLTAVYTAGFIVVVQLAYLNYMRRRKRKKT